ncbi:hypothetical protein NVV94_09485 [Pseudomonas sp. LS1212]|uniref:hypothetical protein n=1 Tax=Pseudomonas sp. LS1212 TaxID=2972478 RepID=UPI00215C0BF6|nr:hypothetical protein [Pseudomonas sp. LS1212]UVJ45750.1 hypothetical protein NVV94_09485 [Pseudomonas sp. LS1212]
MNIVSSLALVVAVGWLSGCATTPDSQIASVALNATKHNAGHIAQATLAPMGSETEIWLFVGGVPMNTALPARLYTYIYAGTCASLGPKPAYEMNQSVRTDLLPAAGIQLWKSVPVAYDQLRTGSYALVVRASPADGNRDIFCGNIT